MQLCHDPDSVSKYQNASSSRAIRGGNFRGEEPISQRKTLPIECTQGDQAVRFPNRILVCSNVPSCGVVVVANFVSWW